MNQYTNMVAIFFSFCFVSKSYNQKVEKCANGFFEEKNGMVVFEAESIPLSDGWALENRIEDYSGEGYITWMDTTTIATKGQGLLRYTIKITKPGTYTVKLRNYHACEDFTECNDVFVKMDDSDWRKNFNHTVGKWDWNSQQDIDHVFSDSEYFLSKGNHILHISGRSQGFSIDKIAIYHNETSKDSYKSVALSECVGDSP